MSAPSYDQVHYALKRERGSAVGLPCSHPDCDRPSSGWALLDHPTHIVINSHGKPVRISTDLDAYGPACTRHNAQRDHGGNWTLCPHGHVRFLWGTDSKGTCRGCIRLGRMTSHLQVGRIAHVVSTNTDERGRS
ncbi:hypothetical protein IT882_15165 [Microbacterium schleiferi]|uniref:Uncharacterized protein n=1 Tax=Microbacterium schleiferi TaxID=69362 RepID=A0A7S8MW92_9MICO|nr:hypothetical protein [Microbacterium schleiferi]QPE04454.1 hypothetical protein IT882_15165 [Microbacterium schleiferi]